MKQTTLDLKLPKNSFKRKARLRLISNEATSVVLLNETPIYQFDSADKQVSRHVAVQLALSKNATQKEVAKLWKVDKRSIWNWINWFRKDGIQGLTGQSLGRPRTVTDDKVAEIVSLRKYGVKLTEIAAAVQLPLGTVKSILYNRKIDMPYLPGFQEDDDHSEASDYDVIKEQDEAEGEDLCGAEKSLAELAEANVDPHDRSNDRMAAFLGLLDDARPVFADCDHVEGAGSLLGVAMLSKDPFLDKIKAAYGAIGPAFYGLRTIFVTLFLMALLRIKNPEQNGKRNPLKLGRLLGLDRSPCTKTIRRKIHTLSRRGKALEVMRSLAEYRSEQRELPDAVLYVDGHVKCYYGKEKIGKTFSTAKNRVVKGETDYWLNQGDGTPILCLPSELNDKMSTMLLRIIEDAKAICAGRRITVVFDRGGSSAAVYEKITKAECDFIAYHKNPKKLDPSEFPLGPTLINGKVYAQAPVSRHIELDVYCRSGGGKYKKTGRTVKVREVVLLRDANGGQTSVVTSREDLKPVQVLEAIFSRWSQENYFKYLLEEYAFDHLCIYGSEPLDEDHDRPNPEYTKLSKSISKLRSKLAQDLCIPLEELAKTLAEKERPAQLEGRITKKRKAILQQSIDRLTELRKRRSEVPERLKPEDLRRLPQESRLVTNLVKMTAYIIEGKLAGILKNLHEATNGNERGLCSGFFQSTGELRVSAGELQITLEKQGDPTRTELLAALCHQVNAMEPLYPGTSLKMVFGVQK